MARGLQYAALNGAKRLSKLKNGIPKLMEENLNRVGNRVIEQWYESYNPIFYDDSKRNGGLFSAYHIDVNKDGNYRVSFSSHNMPQYHQNAEIIYNNAFVQGYHGGSKGEGVSVPTWRRPFPYFTNWGYTAVRTFSPRDMMISEMTKEMNKIEQYVSSEIEDIIDKIVEAI